MTPRLPPGCVIALLGACAAERSALAQALADRLNQRGTATTLVAQLPAEGGGDNDEARAPDEMAPARSARRLQRRIEEAAAQGVAVAADTPLGILACAPNSSDDAAVAVALAAQRRYAITLLVGVDAAPAAAPGDALAALDARLRTSLMDAFIAFSVVHGAGQQRLANAWNAILAGQDSDDPIDRNATAPTGAARRTWAQACDRCSDPACEHQLFTGLLASRGTHGAAKSPSG